MNRRTLMILNHALYHTGRYTQSQALKMAWEIMKHPLTLNAVGVTFANRQTALQHLTRYPRHRITTYLVRDRSNQFDTNAIAIRVQVAGKGSYTVGYLPREWASVIAPLLDRGMTVPARFESVVGGRDTTNGKYGMKMQVLVA
jgi:hypothetical protein